MDRDALRREMERVSWFHTMELAPGLVTPGSHDTAARLRAIGMPADLHAKTVLDVGAWDGFFAFEAERRGAAHVLATDSFAWGDHGTGRAGFELARQALGSRVEDREVDVLELSPAEIGTFHVVLFLGVLYHMRHPLLALERVAAVTRQLLILDTHVDLLGCRRPAAALYPGIELDNDPTSWWGPNPRAVEAMLRTVGFSRVELVWRDGFPYRVGRALNRARKAREPRGVLRRAVATAAMLRHGRVVVHAYRDGAGAT